MPYLYNNEINLYTGWYDAINERKVRELPYHLFRANRYTDLAETLTHPALVSFVAERGNFTEFNQFWSYEPQLAKIFAAYGATSQAMARGIAQFRYASSVIDYAHTVKYSSNDVLRPLQKCIGDNVREGVALRLNAGSAECLEAQGLVHVNRIPEAIQLINTTLQMKGVQARVKGDLLFARGEAFRLGGAMDKAIQDFLSVKELCMKHLKNPELLVAVINALGQTYFLVQQYQQAMNTYREALAYLNEKFGTEDEKYATVCNNLAALFLETQQFQQAEEYFTHACNIRQQVRASTLLCSTLRRKYPRWEMCAQQHPFYVVLMR